MSASPQGEFIHFSVYYFIFHANNKFGFHAKSKFDETRSRTQLIIAW